MQDPVNEMIKRTQRYWYVDGISEIGVGVLFVLLGLSFFVIAWLAPLSPLQGWIVAIGQPLLVILGMWIIRRIIVWAKEHITYPRTGYVVYQRSSGVRRWQRAIRAGVIAAVAGGGVALLQGVIGVDWVPVVSGVLLGMAMLVLNLRLGLLRFGLLALYAVVWGLVTAALQLPSTLSAGVFFGGFGLFWAISGTIVLIRYLRNTQSLAGVEE